MLNVLFFVGLSIGEVLKLWLKHREEAMTNKDERKQVFGNFHEHLLLPVLSPLLLLLGYVTKSSQFLLRFLNVFSKTYMVHILRSFSKLIFVNDLAGKAVLSEPGWKKGQLPSIWRNLYHM